MVVYYSLLFDSIPILQLGKIFTFSYYMFTICVIISSDLGFILPRHRFHPADVCPLRVAITDSKIMTGRSCYLMAINCHICQCIVGLLLIGLQIISWPHVVENLPTKFSIYVYPTANGY